MKDKEFLIWLHGRLGEHHLENLSCEQKPDQNTPASIEDKIAVFRMKYVGTGSGADLLDLIEALNKQKADK